MLGQLGYSGFIMVGSSGGGGTVSGISQINLDRFSFQPDGKTALNSKFISDNINLYWVDLANYLTRGVDWDYVTVPSAGIVMLTPGFDANTSSVFLIASLKNIISS